MSGTSPGTHSQGALGCHGHSALRELLWGRALKPICRGCKIGESWNRSPSRSSRQALWLLTGLWGKSEERQCLFSLRGVGRFGMFKKASPFLSSFYALLSFSCSCLLFPEINLSLLLSSKNRYTSPSNEPRTGVPSNTALKITFAEQKTKTEEKQTWGKWLSGQVQLFWGDRGRKNGIKWERP